MRSVTGYTMNTPSNLLTIIVQSDGEGGPYGGYPDPSLSPRSETYRFHTHRLKNEFKTAAWAAKAAVTKGHLAALQATPDTVMLDPDLSFTEGIFTPSGILEPFYKPDDGSSLPDEDLLQMGSKPTPDPYDSDSSMVSLPKPPSVPYLNDSIRAKIYSYFYLPPPRLNNGWGAQPHIRRYIQQFQFRQHHLTWPHHNTGL